jgi:hypothetical protein
MGGQCVDELADVSHKACHVFLGYPGEHPLVKSVGSEIQIAREM